MRALWECFHECICCFSYDYYSILHPRLNAYSKNGEFTILPNNDTGVDTDSDTTKVGQRDGLSYFDVKRINRVFKVWYKTFLHQLPS